MPGRSTATQPTPVNEAAIRRLREALQGSLLLPGAAGYDDARTIWNRSIDKRPALIVRAANTNDVARSVLFAREQQLTIAVRGGGHSIAGQSVCDGGLMIDLSAMKRIRVDQLRRTAQADAGLKLGEFDRETQAFGLATTLGIATDTGIAGLTLGGGYGWLAGKYGLACDNLLSVDVVTAEGQVVRASERENADLFWGVRGGGGNFGIVTSFEYALHAVGPVHGGLVIFRLSKEALRFFDEFSRSVSDEVSTVGLLTTAPDGTPAFAVAVCHCGSPADAERELKPLRTFEPPLADLLQMRPYVEMQALTDQAWPPGRFYYWKSSLVRSLTDELIDTLIDFAQRKPTPLSVIYLQQLHGAASRVGRTDTAFPHRFDHYNCGAMLETEDPADVELGLQWCRDCWQSMQPHAERLNYANDLGDEGELRVREAFGVNYDRLQTLKNRFDPTNVFRLNQNIRPSA